MSYNAAIRRLAYHACGLAAVALMVTACDSGPPTPEDIAGFTVLPSTLVVSENGGAETFAVVLDAQPESDVVITVTVSDPSEVAVSVTTLIFTPSNWDQPQTVTATGIDDFLVDGDVQSSIVLAVDEMISAEEFGDLVDQAVEVTTTDDDLGGGPPPDEPDAADSEDDTPAPPLSDDSPPPDSDDVPGDDIEDDEMTDYEDSVVSGTLPEGPAPYAGLWEFAMSATASDLSGSECPTSGGVASNGPAELDTYDGGAIVTVDIDGQHLIYNRVDDEDDFASYETAMYNFPVFTPSGGDAFGNVHFTFVALANDYIEGYIHWNNLQGCQGDYLFTMELVEIELPDNIYIMEDGLWELEIAGLDVCDSEIAAFSGLPSGEILMESSANLDVPNAESNYLDFDYDSGNFGLLQDPDSNTYQLDGDSFYLGLPENSDGDLLLDYSDVTFTGVIEATAVDVGQMVGTLTVTGSNGCGFTAPITFSFVGPA